METFSFKACIEYKLYYIPHKIVFDPNHCKIFTIYFRLFLLRNAKGGGGYDLASQCIISGKGGKAICVIQSLSNICSLCTLKYNV